MAEQSFEHDLSVGGRILSRLCICPSIPTLLVPLWGRRDSDFCQEYLSPVTLQWKLKKKERKSLLLSGCPTLNYLLSAWALGHRLLHPPTGLSAWTLAATAD